MESALGLVKLELYWPAVERRVAGRGGRSRVGFTPLRPSSSHPPGNPSPNLTSQRWNIFAFSDTKKFVVFQLDPEGDTTSNVPLDGVRFLTFQVCDGVPILPFKFEMGSLSR